MGDPIDGLFHGKSQSKIDDYLGYPNFRKPPDLFHKKMHEDGSKGFDNARGF